METPDINNIIDIEGTEFEELEEFHIACFEDHGGLMCTGNEGELYGNWDGFDDHPTKFRVHTEEGKYYIKCEHDHFLSISSLRDDLGELNCSKEKPEGDGVVYLEPDERFNSVFQFRTKSGKYLHCDWIKANYGSLYLRNSDEGTFFYLRSAQNV
ncbi:hypothetical protein TRVA0_002S00298 [Trichomonascus vanleenenianus]|uniref:uncharacterized protein n=1 Tax=Trichomonascus vanleenenianus TaxID=2268995 RepID=UPI003EC9C2CF